MERRLFFVAGDVIAIVSTACAASLVSSKLSLVQGALWMPLTMGAGMLAGMVVASLLSFLWMPLFGDFEIMLPTSLSGMVAGMMTGMMAPMWHPTPLASLANGIAIGLACWLWVYWTDSRAARKFHSP